KKESYISVPINRIEAPVPEYAFHSSNTDVSSAISADVKRSQRHFFNTVVSSAGLMVALIVFISGFVTSGRSTDIYSFVNIENVSAFENKVSDAITFAKSQTYEVEDTTNYSANVFQSSGNTFVQSIGNWFHNAYVAISHFDQNLSDAGNKLQFAFSSQ